MNIKQITCQTMLKIPKNRFVDGFLSRILAISNEEYPLRSRSGITYIVGGGDIALRTIRASVVSDEYEPDYISLLMGLVSEGSTVIDVGANEGYVALRLAKSIGRTGHVFAVEAHPSNVTVLKNNISLNGVGNITVIHNAAGDKAGTVILSGDRAWGTLVGKIYANNPQLTIQMDTLDSMLLADARLERLELIKVDVEGFETPAIMGASEILARWKPIVAFEVNLTLLAYSSTPISTLFSFLNDQGYTLYTERRGRLIKFKWLDERTLNLVAFPKSRTVPARYMSGK